MRQSGLAKVYIATAQAFDDEMREKISKHRADRAGEGWRTVEAPRAVSYELMQLEADEIALLDCVTLWLANHMMDGPDWEAELETLCDVLVQIHAPVVIVTNDVGSGIVPENKLARDFQKAQGVANQRLAHLADLVVQVTAGLPQVLKGIDLAEQDPWE